MRYTYLKIRNYNRLFWLIIANLSFFINYFHISIN